MLTVENKQLAELSASVFWIVCFSVSDQYFDTAVVTTGNDLLKSGWPTTDQCQGKEES